MKRDQISNAAAENIFNVMLELEKRAEKKTHDGRDYHEQVNGAFAIILALGLADEYVRWSVGK